MAFKSFKNKIPRAKHYHPSTNAAATTNRNNSNPNGQSNIDHPVPFFDSAYPLYKRHAHLKGGIPSDSEAKESYAKDPAHTKQQQQQSKKQQGKKQPQNKQQYPGLHPIISANTNYIEHPSLFNSTGNNVNVQTNSNANPTPTYTNGHSTVLNSSVNHYHQSHSQSIPNPNTTNIPLNNNTVTSQSASTQDSTNNNHHQLKATLYTANSHNRPLTEADIRDNKNPWEEDMESGLNSTTYLQTHCEKINQCFQLGQYNKINSLYQSLRRNNLIPPLDIYEKIFISFHRRSFDQNNQNLNDKMWQLLNCYQDMINNKLKPNARIYNILLLQIFKNSIVAIETNNLNGLDFFKIGAELLNTVREKNKVSNETINYYLLAMNLYARETLSQRDNSNNKSQPNPVSSIIPDLTHLKDNLIEYSSLGYEKDSFYFINLINLANLKNDTDMIKALYSEFLTLLPQQTTPSFSLRDNQFEIYSMFITAFIETGQISLGTKMFDHIINEIKNKDGSQTNLNMVLSNFIISLSKIDPKRAYSVWFEFNKLDWTPTFSYEFYLLLLSNCFHDWTLTTKLYDYIYPMERSFNVRDSRLQSNKTFRLNSKTDLSTYLLYPIHTENIINSLLDYSLQLNDSNLIMKLLEESMIKNFEFDTNLYPFIFKFLNKIDAPNDYLLRFIDIHGSLQCNLQFINSLTTYFKSNDLLWEIITKPFFQEICRTKLQFDMNSINNTSLSGLISIMKCLWNSPKEVEHYPMILNLHAILITKFFDFDTLDPTSTTTTPSPDTTLSETLEQYKNFKEETLDQFTKLVQNYKRLQLDPHAVDPVVTQSCKFIPSLAKEYVEYFEHPGDWDKDYPLSLGSMIRVSTKTGLKQYERLNSKDYCFDYDTYKELIKHRYYNVQVINKFLQFPQEDWNELKFARNLLISKMKGSDLESMIILNPQGPNFQLHILPFLNELSLLKLMKSIEVLDQPTFLKLINFPHGFKNISKQAEFKKFIAALYQILFNSRYYDLILNLNEICPVLDLEILLESCIRSSIPQYNDKFVALFERFQNDPLLLSPLQRIKIQAEYLISKGQIKDAMEILSQDENKLKDHVELKNLYSFTTFIRSFRQEMLQFTFQPENSIQLANLLSSCSSFISVLTNYDNWKSQLQEQEGAQEVTGRNEAILEQMLQNLEDATKMFQKIGTMDEQVKRTMNDKLKTFYRFKLFLMRPEITTKELQRLIRIWAIVNPNCVEHLFNNIVETVYLDQKNPVSTNTITLNCHLSWQFDETSLSLIIKDISHCIGSNEQNAARLNEFQTLMEKLTL